MLWGLVAPAPSLPLLTAHTKQHLVSRTRAPPTCLRMRSRMDARRASSRASSSCRRRSSSAARRSASMRDLASSLRRFSAAHSCARTRLNLWSQSVNSWVQASGCDCTCTH